MATTKKYLDYDGLVQYTGKVKKAINDTVTDIEGTPSASAPVIASTVNATNNARSGNFTAGGTTDTFAYYDTTYGTAVAGSKDGLMSRTDKTKLDGIATGAEVNVQSDWNQTTTTADDYIKNKPAVNKVKQTLKDDNKSYGLLMTDIATSGTDDEVEYTGQILHNPSTGETTFHNYVNSTGLDVKIKNGGIEFTGGNSINGTSYTGTAAYATKASGDSDTIQNTYASLADLATTDGLTGASMIGYTVDGSSGDVMVSDALDDLYNTIGGSGGSSIMDLIEDLQDGENLIQGTNVTLTKDTTNHTVTIAAADPTVTQTAKSDNVNYPMLLASGATPSTGGANYDSDLKYNPSTNTINIGTGTLTATNYSGTAAKATADGSGNNIVNTYATKSALDALTNKWTGQFKIATSAEATAISQGNASSLELGYIYLVLDSNASSPNVYDEYIKVALGTTPETYSVEKIGTTDAGVDVVSITTAEINTIWEMTSAAS